MIHPTHDMMYFGDDYGGHNIPYPHPAPPKPHKMYDQHAFVDLTTGKHVHGDPPPHQHGSSKDNYSQFIAGEKDGL